MFTSLTPTLSYSTSSLDLSQESKMKITTIILVTLILSEVSPAVRSCPPADWAALTAFKAKLTEPYIGIFNSWVGTDCCNGWYGISCNPDTARVVDINLRGESEDPILVKSGRSGYMSGSISPEICHLDGLTNLILADWKGITGPIPGCLTSLKSLRVLDLIGNKISGPIPSDIGSLQKLTVLNLADNAITGGIPGSIVHLGCLKHLDLANNALTGNIPSDFGNLKMLSRALLARNKLTGPIPGSISGMNRLADLDLSVNQISGPIQSDMGRMRVLSTLNLDSNKITGQIPPALLSSGMGILNLSRNYLEGSLPDVFHQKSYFMALDLSYNNLKGLIPPSLSSARYIGHLDLSHNHLCGTIPVGAPFDHLEASSFASNDCLH